LNLAYGREPALGARTDARLGQGQFNAWVDEDEPFRQVMSSPPLTRARSKFLNIASLPDSTVVVEFVTQRRDGQQAALHITFRYQVKPVDKEAMLGTNPFGVFHLLQHSEIRGLIRAIAHGSPYPSRFVPLAIARLFAFVLSAPDGQLRTRVHAVQAQAFQPGYR
jgi:hypothetical protein